MDTNRSRQIAIQDLQYTQYTDLSNRMVEGLGLNGTPE